MDQKHTHSASSQRVPARYRVDILKDGVRWADPVGLTATADTIAATAVGLVAEVAVESRPDLGLCCCAEVFDEDDNFVLSAEVRISDHESRIPLADSGPSRSPTRPESPPGT